MAAKVVKVDISGPVAGESKLHRVRLADGEDPWAALNAALAARGAPAGSLITYKDDEGDVVSGVCQLAARSRNCGALRRGLGAEDGETARRASRPGGSLEEHPRICGDFGVMMSVYSSDCAESC